MLSNLLLKNLDVIAGNNITYDEAWDVGMLAVVAIVSDVSRSTGKILISNHCDR